MNNLFTLLTVNETYCNFSIKLINDLLEKTSYDIMVSTNCPNIYAQVNSPRVTVRDITKKLEINQIGLGGFNYNLKFYAFEEIPEKYDSVFYLDCDQQIIKWNDESFKTILTNFFKNGQDFIATRTQAILRAHMENYIIKQNPDLFSHKINNYGLRFENTPDKWLDARMPSEHFLVLKNDPKKMRTFCYTWKMLNALSEQLGAKNHGTWGDGFEIGISAISADYNMVDVGGDIQAEVFGIVFNGNKK